jgi:hypothetical protein
MSFNSNLRRFQKLKQKLFQQSAKFIAFATYSSLEHRKDCSSFSFSDKSSKKLKTIVKLLPWSSINQLHKVLHPLRKQEAKKNHPKVSLPDK